MQGGESHRLLLDTEHMLPQSSRQPLDGCLEVGQEFSGASWVRQRGAYSLC